MMERAAAAVIFIGTAVGLSPSAITTSVLGVSVAAVCGAALGALAAIGIDETDRPKGRKYVLAFSLATVACFVVGVAPSWRGWEWYSERMEGALCGGVTVVMYLVGPEVLKRVRETIATAKFSDLVPWLRKRDQKQ